jgi:hypothetical protein
MSEIIIAQCYPGQPDALDARAALELAAEEAGMVVGVTPLVLASGNEQPVTTYRDYLYRAVGDFNTRHVIFANTRPLQHDRNQGMALGETWQHLITAEVSRLAMLAESRNLDLGLYATFLPPEGHETLQASPTRAARVEMLRELGVLSFDSNIHRILGLAVGEARTRPDVVRTALRIAA